MTQKFYGDHSGLRLLSFDGGCSRATSQLTILREMMCKIQRGRDSNKPLLPCKYFHMMGGADTGGIIVVMLTRLEMSADEASEEFEIIREAVYTNQEYSAEERTTKLKCCIEALLMRRNMPLDSKMLDSDNNNSCQGFVIARTLTSTITKFRTYVARTESSTDITVVDAVLATCALQPSFLPAPIGSKFTQQEFIGGGTGASNPVREVMDEAQLLFGRDASVASLISVGAGCPEVGGGSPADNFGVLGQILKNCEETAKAVEARLAPLGFYFRFSFEQGLRPDAPPSLVMVHTHSYLQDPLFAAKLDHAVMALESQLGSFTFDQISGSLSTRETPKGLPPLTAHFVMRQEPWALLKNALLYHDKYELGQKLVVISGPPGSGKTQLTIKFAKEHKAMYDHIVWVDGSSEATIKADLISHVRSLGPQHSHIQLDGALAFFTNENKRWFIVYDNVDDVNLDVSRLIPSPDHGSIAITTRNRELGQLASEIHLELGVMTQNEAIEVLRRSAKLKVLKEDDRNFAPLAEELGLLPVALVSAGSYLFQTKCSPQEYLAFLQDHRQELLEHSATAQRDKQHRSAYAAFDVSYQQLPSQVSKFLHLISFYHHTKFPLAIISHAAKQGFDSVRFSYVDQHPLFDEAVRLLNEIFCPNGVWEDLTLHKILRTLQNYSLATISSNHTTVSISLHPLIHAFYSDRLPAANQELFQTASLRLLGCWAQGSVHEDSFIHNAAYQWGLGGHVNRFLQQVNKISINDRATIAIIIRFDRETSIKIWEDILANLRSLHGSTNAGVADVLVLLASSSSPDFTKARMHYEEAIRIRGSLLGSCHEDTLCARIVLAKGLICAGMYKEAGIQLETLQRDLPQDSDHAIDLTQELGRLYQRRGNYAEAEALQVRHLQYTKKKFGEIHAGNIPGMSALGETYLLMGRYTDAENLGLQILQVELPFKEHQEGALQRIFLSMIYCALGRYEEAEAIQSLAIRKCKEMGSSEDRGTLFTLGRVYGLRAETLYLQGRYRDAEDDCKRALDIWLKLFGTDHPGILKPTGILALVHHSQGRYTEAELLQLEMIERRMKFHDGLHPFVFTCHADLTLTWYSQGRLDEARERQEWVLEKMKEWLGEMVPEVGTSMYALARTYRALKRLEEAKGLAIWAEEIQKKILGERHPHYLKTVDLLRELEQAAIEEKGALRLSSSLLIKTSLLVIPLILVYIAWLLERNLRS